MYFGEFDIYGQLTFAILEDLNKIVFQKFFKVTAQSFVNQTGDPDCDIKLNAYVVTVQVHQLRLREAAGGHVAQIMRTDDYLARGQLVFRLLGLTGFVVGHKLLDHMQFIVADESVDHH